MTSGGRAPTLLVVDDEARILSAIHRSMRREGFEILLAGGADEALALLDEQAVDFVLSDQKMPGMSGLELLEEVARRWPGVGRALLTGWPEEVPRKRADAAGIVAILSKPWDDAELKAQLAELLDGVKESDQRAEPRPPAGKGTIGEQFANSPEFEAWMKQVAPNGQIPDGMKRFTSPPVNFKGLLRKLLQRKDLITGASDTSAGAFVETDYTGIYEPIGYWPLTLRDLISVGTTGSDLVEFVRETKQVTEIEVPEVDFSMWSHLSWSPDGRRIAFRRRLRDHIDRQPGDVGGIAVVNVDGSDFVQLTFDDEDRYPAWSPDGLRIAFVRGGDIYLIASDGTEVTRLTDGGKRRDPAWSPDGAKIAFVSTRNSECTTFMDSTFCTSELYVMDADGSNERLVRSEKNEAIYDPDWAGGQD